LENKHPSESRVRESDKNIQKYQKIIKIHTEKYKKEKYTTRHNKLLKTKDTVNLPLLTALGQETSAITLQLPIKPTRAGDGSR